MRVLTVVGARPQFVKAAVVSRALRASGRHEEVLVHTGQHYDSNMSQVFFEELGIPEPDHHLGVGSSSHGDQTGRMLIAIEPVIVAAEPDVVLVYGDTNSTLAGALAAAKLHVPVAHVEAGLRSFNRRMPEEVNRVLTDHLSDLLFTPTATATANLLREGVDTTKVFEVGDVMYDASLYYARQARDRDPLRALGSQPAGGYVLATIHRAENTDAPDRLEGILEGLAATAEDLPVVLPLHPRTRRAIERQGLERLLTRLVALEPVGYLDMLALEARARAIVTDSGGVQKEAYFLRVPCVTVRDETEWTETVAAGWNRLVTPLSAAALRDAVRDALNAVPDDAPPFYGGGDAARRIVEALEGMWNKGT